MNPYSKELLCGAKKVNMPKLCNDIWKMMQHEKRGDFMYESPITNYISEIIDKQMVERENFILVTISESIGVNVNREELIKALNYDRNQYEKGYADAKAEYESMLDKIRAEIEKDWQLNKYPSSPFSCGLMKAIELIDKYKAESEDKE